MSARKAMKDRFDRGFCMCGACEQEFEQLLDAFAAEVKQQTLQQAAHSIFVAMHDGARTAKPGWCAGMIHASDMLRPKTTLLDRR